MKAALQTSLGNQPLRSCQEALKLERAKYFDYLWGEVLGMNLLVLEVFANKAVTASSSDPIIPVKEEYFRRKC